MCRLALCLALAVLFACSPISVPDDPIDAADATLIQQECLAGECLPDAPPPPPDAVPCPTETCYTGPASTLGNGPCHAGFSFCIDGERLPCAYERLPVQEAGVLVCDGIDDDCDGAGDVQSLLVDVVVVLDTSGSMGVWLPDIKRAIALLNESGALGENAALRFGLVEVSRPADEPKYVRVVVDETEWSGFLLKLDQTPISNGAEEPTLDAVEGILDGNLGINLRPGSRPLIVVFGDEIAQSVIGLTNGTLCTHLAPATLLVFTAQEFFSDWSLCAETAPLSSASEMAGVMESAMGALCN